MITGEDTEALVELALAIETLFPEDLDILDDVEMVWVDLANAVWDDWARVDPEQAWNKATERLRKYGEVTRW